MLPGRAAFSPACHRASTAPTHITGKLSVSPRVQGRHFSTDHSSHSSRKCEEAAARLKEENAGLRQERDVLRHDNSALKQALAAHEQQHKVLLEQIRNANLAKSVTLDTIIGPVTVNTPAPQPLPKEVMEENQLWAKLATLKYSPTGC